jgi:hypothetical protein
MESQAKTLKSLSIGSLKNRYFTIDMINLLGNKSSNKNSQSPRHPNAMYKKYKLHKITPNNHEHKLTKNRGANL